MWRHNTKVLDFIFFLKEPLTENNNKKLGGLKKVEFFLFQCDARPSATAGILLFVVCEPRRIGTGAKKPVKCLFFFSPFSNRERRPGHWKSITWDLLYPMNAVLHGNVCCRLCIATGHGRRNATIGKLWKIGSKIRNVCVCVRKGSIFSFFELVDL